MTDRREKIRAVFLTALMIGSVFGAGISLTGSAVAAENAGPEEFSDLGTDAGVLAAGETAVVQTIEVNDTDGGDDTNATTLTSVNVNSTASNTVSASNVSEVAILSSDGTVLNSSSSPSAVFSGGQDFDITDVTIPDNGSTEIQVQVTIASDASDDGETLALQTAADWTEGGSSDTTSAVADGATETLDTVAPDLSSASTADSDNDGTVDTISVTFSENVNDNTVEAGDFSLSSGSVDGVDTGSTANDTTLDLTVSGVGDTAASPDVNVSANSVEDTAGNAGPTSEQQVTATDNAQPVVTDVTLNQTVVNNADAPADVEVNLTFSENVTGWASDTVQLQDGSLTNSPLNVTGTDDNDTFSGTVTITDNDDDVVANLTVSGLTGENGNSLVAYDQEKLTVDTDESLSLVSAETADLEDDGMVDTINATFSDDVDDSTVQSAIDDNDFSIKEGTIESLNGGVADDDTVSLEVSGVGDTAATDEITLFSKVLEDTAGNPGPNAPTGINVDDGASPIVTDVTLNDTVVNKSEAPVDVEINATFSESLDTDDPDVSVLGLSQSPTTVTQAGDGDNELSVVATIQDNTEDVEANVEISGGNDGSGNSVETFNETRLTVDTEVPSVTVNGTEAPVGEVVSDELDLTTFFDIQNDDGGTTTYLINTTNGGSDYTEVSDPSSFDTKSIDDTAYLTVRAVDTDDVENEDQATTGDINVDNTAPDVTIDVPSETQASQSDGTLYVETTIDELNPDENATVVLEGGDNYIEYNATTTDLDSGIDLRLNTSANASANGARLPDLNATEGSFDTQTVYDLSVTVNDTTGKSTTETKSDALFLDDTDPANFSLVEPTTPTEYVTGDGLQIAYGYTEDNTDEVTVSLTNESGAVANMTVDESLYVDDGVIKSFEANLFESFDTSSLADGRYNVSVTVTDLAGNELTDSTDNAPVAINNDDKPASDPQFNSGPDASVSVNKSAKEVTVDVSYNVSVPSVTDAGDIDQTQDALDSVDITADNIGQYTVQYWDASADSYDTVVAPVNVTFSGENATENVDITETATLDLDTLEPTFEEDDRVTTRYLDIDGTYDEVAVELTDSSEDSQTQSDVVNYGTETFASESPAEPDIESIEVAGADTPNDHLVIEFTRPVKPDGGFGSVSADDFAYEDVSGDGANYVTEVQGANTGDDIVAIVLDEDVTAEDVGSDVVSIQPNTLANSFGSNAPAMNGTVDESDAPGFTSSTVDVGDDASTVDVTFNQKVVAEDGEALTADNFTYTGDASVESVDHQAESDTATVHLDSEVAEGELGSEMIVANDVADRFGNVASPAVTVVDETSPSNIEILEPTDQQIVQSGDLFDVSYQYVDNVPDNVDNAVVKLEGDTDTYTYQVDDTSYVTNVSKSLTLDLDDGANGALTDGAYNLTIEVTDADGNMDSVTMEDAVVVNDEGPDVSDVTVTSSVDDVAPDSTLNVTYDYEPAPNATSVMVWVVDTDDLGNFTGDLENVTYEVHEVSVDHGIVDDKKVSVDLSGDLPDNEEYAVYVSATDVSGLMSDLRVAGQPVDVNAEKPTIESVEANTGDDSITVKFNEDVTTTDGDSITRADFAYQDVNSAGASNIESVDDMGDEVVLHLDSDVTTSDLGSDLVNVADGALEDMDEHDPRPVDSNAVALSDSTEPTVGLVDAGPINANNEESYTVTVGTTSEVTDVSVTLTGPSGTELSASDAAATGDATLTFNASTLEDGPVDVDVELTDAGDNTASTSVTTEKDTVVPTIEVAAANPGGSLDAGGKTQIVVVTFSEAVDADSVSTDAFTVTSDAHSVDDVLNSGLLTNDNEVWLLLNQSVPTAAIDDGSVAQVEAPGITDEVGHGVTNAVNLTDEDAGSMYAPTHTPSFGEISADAGDENVTVTFDEVVEAGDGGDLTAANFTYLDTNSANASAVDSVTQTGPQTVVVTLDAELTDGDLAYDRLAVNEDAVFDTSGNVMPTDSTPFDLDPGLSTSTEDGAVTLQVTTLNDIETAVGDGLTVEETNLELASLEGFTLEDRFTANVSAEDFTEVEPGVYETSVDVPGDDAYTVSGLVDGEVTTEQVIVNEEAPHPTDAAILDVTSEAQLDDTRGTTHIRVLFNEPVDASEILPSDVSIENFDGEIVEVRDGGLFGSIEIVVDGQVQTGASPDVTIAGDSYADLAGTSGASEGETVVHTDTLQLSEGQNFVSVPAAAGELSLSELDTSAVDAIYAYDAESESWDAYDPDAPSNDFTSLEGGEGYIFAMDADATLDVNVYNIAGADAGADVTAPAPNQQTLTEGWNLIGHYQEYDQAVPTALSSVGMSSVYEVYAQSDSSASLEYQSYAAGDFDSMERSEAYWVFVTNDEVYTEANGQYIQDPVLTNTAAVAV
ncbi:surface glycoprotein [Halobacterium bonnevillei]|uniref:Cadherin domain-containing protein n=1 Tax=Halobacterium bonnevillei TaxID=2692200 RepID=A0A6B0SE42_9EURY|nr:surface glycoprotein [Halobacterium bonnevillei]MXR19974.1 hypothetical protein [Halobacterium bonnevillei]